jgi:predicted CopG family antitoxin
MADRKTIRIDREIHAELKTIAEEEGLTLTDTLRKLVEEHRRDRLFEQADRAYQRLREESEDQDEIEVEPGSFLDGLEDVVGSVEGPSDLSTNPEHMNGYGES